MNWRRASVAIALTIPVVIFLIVSMGNDPRLIRSPLIGSSAPEFELGALDSEILQVSSLDSIRLADHRGSVVVLNFWASWCGPCRIEHPGLVAVARVYRDQGVRFFGVLYKDSPQNARRWLNELGEAYPTAVDPAARTAIAYGMGGVPETFFIDREGRVAYKYVGPIPADTLVAHIEALLAMPAATELSGPEGENLP